MTHFYERKETGVADNSQTKTTAPDAARPFTLRWVMEWVILAAIAFVLALGIKTFVVQPFVIPSGSMEPAIQIGDRVLVNRFIYRFAQPRRGDIIVFEPWEDGQPDLIKRVIAVGGETIAMDADGRFTVDGKPIDERYVTPANRITQSGRYLPMKVPAGSVFVMGDNRNNSVDSRVAGSLPKSNVVGKAWFIYWPPTQWQLMPHVSIKSGGN